MEPNCMPFTVRRSNVERYLPTYEEANVPYSLRLPTYRSSYIRRFHPYARYVPHPLKGYDEDDEELEDPQARESLSGPVLLLHHIGPALSANNFVADSLGDIDAFPFVSAEQGERNDEGTKDMARQAPCDKLDTVQLLCSGMDED